MRALVRDADVLIENFKVGGLARYGLDYASLSAVNPRLVYCSITGFGQDGPYAARAGYDFMIQGMGGIMDLTGEPRRRAAEDRRRLRRHLHRRLCGDRDPGGAARARRDRRGRHIDMALLDVQVAVLANQAMNYLVVRRGAAPARQRPSQHRALPGVRGRRRPCHRRGRQ